MYYLNFLGVTEAISIGTITDIISSETTEESTTITQGNENGSSNVII